MIRQYIVYILGGFSEYFYHCNTWQCKGFGFTLRGPEDFKLNKFNSNAPCETFTALYGESKDGEQGNGDITITSNMEYFRKHVLNDSRGGTKCGVHVVMADGGFDVRDNYNSQELLSRQLILCQFTTAISVLRKGGVFVCKLFDCFHPFTISLLYILYMNFEYIGLIKPNQSRPANSERYIIAKYFKHNFNHIQYKDKKPDLLKYLYNINNMINDSKTKSTGVEVAPLIPVNKMYKPFIKWIKSFNEINVKRQIIFLNRIKMYLEDSTLKTDDQSDIRKKSLDKWFYDSKKQPRIIYDNYFGRRYVTNRPDFNFNNYTKNQRYNNRGYNNNRYNNNRDGFDGGYLKIRPVSTLIVPDQSETKFGREILQRIEFEAKNCVRYLGNDELFGKMSDLRKYQLRGEWFTVGFEIKNDKCPPEWVCLIGTKHGIFEMKRDIEHQFPCKRITNNLLKLPADTVIDCIKTFDDDNEHHNDISAIYNVIDAWCIGSKSLYNKGYLERQEFCRVLIQSYGSRFLKIGTGVPILQSLNRPVIKNMLYQHKKHLSFWFIRTIKSPEARWKKFDEYKYYMSKYYRPVSIKVWQSNCPNLPKFDDILKTLYNYDNKQLNDLKNNINNNNNKKINKDIIKDKYRKRNNKHIRRFKPKTNDQIYSLNNPPKLYHD